MAGNCLYSCLVLSNTITAFPASAKVQEDSKDFRLGSGCLLKHLSSDSRYIQTAMGRTTTNSNNLNNVRQI